MSESIGECCLCKAPLTRENINLGFGAVIWRTAGPERQYDPPIIGIKQKPVCVNCAERAHAINEKEGVYIYGADGPKLSTFLLEKELLQTSKSVES